jgi:phosphoglycerate kinase
MDDLEVSGKRVLVRADFDGVLDDGRVVDDSRIRDLLPTVQRLVERGARVILMGHAGEPGGRVVPKLSLEPLGMRLAELLTGGEVILTDACVGDGAKRVVLDLRDGEVALLENLRFHAGEALGDDKFARELASLGEVYIAEASGLLHLEAASTVKVPRLVKKRGCGLLVARELDALDRLTNRVDRPFVVIVGGAGFSRQVALIQGLMEGADTLICGGEVAVTLVAARRRGMGEAGQDQRCFPLARNLMARVKASGKKLLLPVDFAVAKGADSAAMENVSIDQVTENHAVVDIGSETRALYRDVISRAGTVCWVGAMGVLENEISSDGTLAVARSISGSAGYSVAAGGESARAVRKFGLEKGFDHVSTGGEATLRFLEGRSLVGIGPLAKR